MDNLVQKMSQIFPKFTKLDPAKLSTLKVVNETLELLKNCCAFEWLFT